MSAANNNGVLLGAIAAVGLGSSSAAAAHSFAPTVDQFGVDTGLMMTAGMLSKSFASEKGELIRDALGGEIRETVEDPSTASSSEHRSPEDGQHSLTSGESGQGAAPTALLEGTEAVQSAPAQSTLTSAAVGMPSAQMLEAANANANESAVEGVAKSTGEVGRVIADALAGGSDGPNIDAVLDALTARGHNGAAVKEALASDRAGDVSGWDTAGFAGFPGGHSPLTMENMALHPDAVQPAA